MIFRNRRLARPAIFRQSRDSSEEVIRSKCHIDMLLRIKYIRIILNA